jgi:phytoene dehydrogenase-like protein
MKYDIIIIGSGLGGLTAGAKLAKEGKKVLLVEQHDRPGGCASTFKRKDFTFEVGLHEMDGLDRRDMKTRIFNDLGVFDDVEFLKVPEFYHFINGRCEITMPHDPDKAIKVLTA